MSFLWTEIEAWAWRMLSDVHTLARAYGWGERDILALSPTRRQFYLEMGGHERFPDQSGGRSLRCD